MVESISKKIYKFKNGRYITKGLFFLLLGISSNYLGDTFSCQIQKLLTESTFCKQVLIFLIIYFGLDISSSNETLSPDKTLKISLYIYLFYLAFSSMNFKFNVISFMLLAAIYHINNIISFYKKNKTKKEINKLKSLRHKLLFILIICIAVGFFVFLRNQYLYYRNNWNFIDFIFGTTNCNLNKELRYDLNLFRGRYEDLNMEKI